MSNSKITVDDYKSKILPVGISFNQIVSALPTLTLNLPKTLIYQQIKK